MTKKKLRKQFKRFANTSEQPLKLYSGSLGIYIGGKQYVDVPNRPGFVYVRLLNDISQLIQAHNQTVSPVYDLPILVVRANNRYEIYARDTATYGSYWNTTSSYLPRHGGQHEFDPDNNGGGDLVFVHGEQFYPMMTFPSGTDGAGNVLIAPYRYFFSGYWRYTGNTGTDDLLQYKPTGSANAKLILVGVTTDTGNPFVKTGLEFGENITGAAEMTAHIPTNINIQSEIPGAIVRLVTGTSTITWANIYDARQYMGILQGSTGSFLGSFLDLSDAPSSYSGQGSKSVNVKSNETGLEFVVPVTTFLGLTDTPSSYTSQANKFVAVKGTADGLEFVNSPGGGGGSGALSIYDDSVFVATGTSISFDAGLDVVATGTTIFVSSPAAAPAMTLIGKYSLSTAAKALDITNIPSTYSSLLLVGRLKTSYSNIDIVGMRFNDISGGFYHFTQADAQATSWAVSSLITGSSGRLGVRFPANPAPVGAYASVTIEIPDYANSGTYTTALIRYGSLLNLINTNGPNEGISSVTCAQFIAVDKISFISLNAANIISGSYFSVYGLT